MDACECHGPAPMAVAITTTIISCLLSFVTISGNALICFAIFKDPYGNLRSPFMYFVVNLAASDLVTGCITMPSSVIIHIVELCMKRKENFDTLMHFMRLTYFISVHAILMSLIALSVDRYLAVARPFSYRRHTGIRGRIAITVAIWLSSISLPMLYFVTDYFTFLLIFANASVVVVLGILFVTYFKAYRSLKDQSNKICKLCSTANVANSRLCAPSCLLRERDDKVTHAFLIILMVFACCYIPVIIIIYVLKFYPICNCTMQHALRDSQFVLGLTFSAATPFVCVLHHGNFRKAALRILNISSASS